MVDDPHVAGGVRLQKVLSQAGVASRRASEALINQGRVTVDGNQVRKQGTRVDPDTQVVAVDGKRISVDSTKKAVVAFNKPVGVVSTMDDPEGRSSLGDYLQDYPQRLYHVGRLDVDTSGLLLLTNDGELANRLAHPSYEVPKTYVARVHGQVKPFVRKELLRGIELDDGPVQVDSFKVKEQFGDITTVEITLHEGRNRVVRRVMEQIGFPVRELVRTRFGAVSLDRLKQGDLRRIRGPELTALYEEVDL